MESKKQRKKKEKEVREAKGYKSKEEENMFSLKSRARDKKGNLVWNS